MTESSAGSKSTSRTVRSDELCIAIVEAVAAAEGVDPLELEPPLHDAIEPDALEQLFPRRGEDEPAADGLISFEYCGHRVTVGADGRVALTESDLD